MKSNISEILRKRISTGDQKSHNQPNFGQSSSNEMQAEESSQKENILKHDHRNDTLFDNLSQCFSDTIDARFNSTESQDIFSESPCGNKRSQSTPLETKMPSDKKIKVSAKQLDMCFQSTKNNINVTNVLNDDPFNESLNISYFNCNEMHMKNLEKTVLNDASNIKKLSQKGKNSQYKKEVLQTFDKLDSTICQINGGLFDDEMENDPNIFNNNASWDCSGIDNTLGPILPPNLTQILAENSNKTHNESILNRSSQIPIKKNRTPLIGNHYRGDFYGLPPQAKMLIKQYKGIEQLYDWQNECLTLPAIEKRENLIYALPTSGGKTLVAEILMLREVICRKKNVLFILPFVSIVQEKVWGLSPFAVGLDFLIEEYAAGKGTFPPRKRRVRNSIYIATLEKGLSLVRSLLENGRMNEIGLIVVDELHLVGEGIRGCTLEMLLTNVMYSGEDIQIIGMSATIGNIEELAKFLNAQVFRNEFRPVELIEYIKLDKNIMKINWNGEDLNEKVIFDRKINFEYSPQIEKIDPDHLGGLVMEVIPNGSCLIFCPTKKNCENVAILLCKVIFKQLLQYKTEEKTALVSSLKAEGCGDDTLLSLIPWGVAFHHSGIAAEERRLIEDAYRSGILSVICCTSTLAAGVNLPAQRVILRAPIVGRDFISLSTYKQMVGRAGRAGFGGHGDSILICSSTHIERVKTLLNSPMDKATSSLHCYDGGSMRSFILGAIALEIANTRKKLMSIVNCSLLAVQAERLNVDVKQLVDKTIETLFKMKAITKKNKTATTSFDILDSISLTQHTRNSLDKNSEQSLEKTPNEITVSNNTELVVSRLGKAAVKGSIDLQRAHMLYADLCVAQNSLVLIGVSHLLYLVTPYDLSENIKLNLSNYYSIVSNLDSEMNQTAKVIGFTESTAVQMARGKTPRNISERVLNRFYVTLMLQDLWNQKSLLSVSEKFQVDRGMVQNLMLGAATFASSVFRFCEELEEFWAFRDLLKNFNQRLSHFCSLELLPLMELPSVKKNRAMQLYKAGFKTIQSIAQAKPIELIESIEHITRNVANQLIAAAKLLLLEKVENLREEAEEVMIGLDNRM